MPRPAGASGTARRGLYAVLLCGGLCFVPGVRLPASIVLLCLLPGVLVCRRWLGVTSWARCLILGGPITLAIVPAVLIPVSLLVGRPTPALIVALTCAITIAALLGRAPDDASAAPLPRLARAHLVIVAGLGAVLQGLATALIYPAADVVRWKGLPDLMFFNGIYRQIALHMPPLDPENGAALLVHNWIYHFHFASLQIVSGMSIPSMQRVVSCWMALVLLGLVYLLCHDVLKMPAAGLLACLLVSTSGEITWLVRSAAHLSLDLRALPWVHSPIGVTLLMGWYNLPPLAAALAAWYWFERHRATGRAAHLAASIGMCVALAFFHPVFYGVFMIGFCLWLGWLWVSGQEGGLRPSRLIYLLTPLPFFLLYKLPYYGMASPPPVVHPATSLATILGHAKEVALSGGLYLALAIAGLAIARRLPAPLVFVAAASLALRLLVRSPNPHWFNDLLYLALAIAGGLGLAHMMKLSRAAGVCAAGASLLVAGVSFGLHLETALSDQHVYTGDEIAAGAWLSQNTTPDDLVAILPNSESSYTVLGRGGRRVAHGWTGHLLDFHPYARRQEAELVEMYTTADAARAAELAARYRIDWVYLGPAERRVAVAGGPSGACFAPRFSSLEVEVRAFTCGEAMRARAAAGRP